MTFERTAIRRLQDRVAAALDERVSLFERDADTAMSSEDRRALTQALIVEAIGRWREEQLRAGAELPSAADEDAIAEDIFSNLWGFGLFDRLLRRPGLEDIVVNGTRQGFLYF